MKTIVRLRWVLLAAWLAVAAGMFVAAPNLQEIVHEKGMITLPEGYPSELAGKLLDEMGEDGTSAVFVFHDEDGLDEGELGEVRAAVERFSARQKELGLTSVTSHFDQPELKGQMVSEDGTTVLVLLGLESDGLSTADQRDVLYEAIEDIKVAHYLTGSMLIDEDVMISSQEGVKKTELITVVFILVILFAVYRSAIAPFVPLLTIGISYLAAQSIVSYLGAYADFPLSTFTQIFMVAVMFGIGTDYSILLISRYKEELALQASRVEAVVATYRTAGKTVFFSGLAVLIGFVAIGFSQFILYRSAVAVAVGVAVMLVALFTLMPFFLAVFGSALFWPGNRSLGHSDSRLWGWAGKLSLSRPLAALIIVAVVTVPLLIGYNGAVSYNSLDEIGEKYDSVRAFNIISSKFGPGETLPTTVVLKHEEPLDNPQGMAWIERISRELLEVDGVKSVRSATRPAGEPIEDLEVSGQAGMLQEGLDQGVDGIVRVRDGLSEAADGLKASEPQLADAEQAAASLASGTAEVAEGLRQLSAGLGEIESGVRQGSLGAGQLRAGLEEIRRNAETLRQSYVQLAQAYRELGEGVRLLAEQYGNIASGLNGLVDGLAGLEQTLNGVQSAHAELGQDVQFQTAMGMLAQLKSAAEQLAGGSAQLNSQLAAVQSGLAEAGAGFDQANAGQAELYGAFDSLIAGLADLERGLAQAADGQQEIVRRVPEAVDGLAQISDGQLRLGEGFSELNSQLGQLTDGLAQSVDGLTQIGDGLKEAADYLRVLATNDESAIGGWYMPEEVLEQEDFAKVLDAYLSKDRKTVKLDVIFADHPYDSATLAKIDEVYAAVDRAVQGTELESSVRAAGGVTSIYHDLSQISSEDFRRTALIMLTGIFLVLMALLRSLVMPIYLMASLLLTYYTSVAFAEWLFVDLLGYAGLTWAVPFFSFVMLLALGIDYSIFLMGRFNEYRDRDPKDAILEAMKKMGTVIFSAVIILGGTFAAMLPSGVLSVMQIATVVLAGLVLYALVYLPLFIPMMVRMFGPANWWPFMSRRVRDGSGWNE
mgnify:CR=1 FL=1